MDRRSLLAGLGVASCAALVLPGSARAHQGGNGGCDPKDVVLGLMGAFEMLDADEITSWLHEDILYQNTGLPDFVGTAAVAQFMSLLAPAFESLVVDMVSIMSKGKLVCTERIEHYVVAQDSPIGIPGAQLTMKIAGWHEIKHGKVIRWTDHWDTRSFSDTLGIPLPAA